MNPAVPAQTGDSITFRYESAFQQQPLRPAELAALAAAADGARCGGLPRRHERGGDNFSSTRTLILCVVSLRVRASDSLWVAGELEA